MCIRDRRKTTYEIQFNMNKFNVELNCNCWWMQHLDFSQGDISVRMNTVRDGEVYGEYVQTITKDNLKDLRKFKRMRFN